MIKEVDEDGDNMISFREFLMIFKKAAAGELSCEGLTSLAESVNVAEVGSPWLCLYSIYPHRTHPTVVNVAL